MLDAQVEHWEAYSQKCIIWFWSWRNTRQTKTGAILQNNLSMESLKMPRSRKTKKDSGIVSDWKGLKRYDN